MPAQAKSMERPRLILLGDVMLGRLVNQVLAKVPPEYPWGDAPPRSHVERNDESFVFALDFDGRQLRRLLLIPTVIRNLQAQLARGREQRDIRRKMLERSAALGTLLHETPEGLELAPVREERAPEP